MDQSTKASQLSEHSKNEDREFIKQNLYKGVGAISFLFASMLFIGVYFESHFNEVSNYVAQHANWLYVSVTVFAVDFFITPFPPDILLILLTKNGSMSESLKLAFLFGVASTLAGHGAWACGRYFVKPHWFGESFKKFLNTHHIRINRLGKWMVFLGAITPLPYSLTCWAAGLLKMDLKDFSLAASPRLLRFVLYYFVIHSSQKLGILLQEIF